MENKQDYIARLQVAISQLHGCGAVHRETVPVHEVFQGQTVWQGEVEVFDLTGHPKAKRAYGWSHREGKNDEGERFVAVLDIPPVVSPITAIRASIISDKKKRNLSVPHEHNWDFFDSFPGHEIYRCTICQLKKFVNLKTGKETFE